MEFHGWLSKTIQCVFLRVASPASKAGHSLGVPHPKSPMFVEVAARHIRFLSLRKVTALLTSYAMPENSVLDHSLQDDPLEIHSIRSGAGFLWFL